MSIILAVLFYLYLHLHSSPLFRLEPGWSPRGLSEEQASLILKTHGPNTPVAERPLAALRMLWGAIINPFNILLTILAIISAATQQIPTFVVMMAMVLASTGLRFVDSVSV
jgi:Mg2+-importing ATPase